MAVEFAQDVAGVALGGEGLMTSRPEIFHTGWDLGVLAEIPAAAMAPQTVAGGLPDGIVAVALSEPTDSLESCLVWRADEYVARRRGIRRGRQGGLRPSAGTSGVARATRIPL